MLSFLKYLTCVVVLVVVTVDAQESCSDNGIVPGDELNATCTTKCGVDDFEIFDYAEVSQDDPNILIRNTVCRCNSTNFECWDTMEVWDKSVRVQSCDNYNITSGTTCKNFCSDIDPKSNDWSTNGGQVTCICADTKICEGNQIGDDDLASSAAVAGVSAFSAFVVWLLA
jgi:hypothetical protein